MNPLFEKILAAGKSFYSAYRRLVQIKWVRITLQAVLIVASLIYLISAYRQYGVSIQDIQVNYWKVGVSFLVVILNILLGALIWWLLLHSLAQPTEFLASSRNHLVSNLAKYIPGYAWQWVGKSYLSYQQGITGGVIVQGLSFEFGLLIAVGVAFGLLMVPGQLLAEWPLTRAAPQLARAACLGLAILTLSIVVALPKIIARGKIKIPVARISTRPYLLCILVIFASWWILSFAFWQLGAAFASTTLKDYPTYAFAMTASILIGLAILVVPNGIGVRESLMVFLLQPVLPAPLAVLVATLFRLLTIFGDFISASIILAWQRLSQI